MLSDFEDTCRGVARQGSELNRIAAMLCVTRVTDSNARAADGTFVEGEERRRPALVVVPVLGFLVAVSCLVAAVTLSAETRPARSMMMQKNGQRTMKLSGFTYQMQQEADKVRTYSGRGTRAERHRAAARCVP